VMAFDRAEVRERILSSPIMAAFRSQLFARVVPNVKRLGLLTPRVRRAYDQIGVLQFEDADPEAQDRALGLSSADPPYFFTVNTGHGAFCTTRSAMLPSSRCLRPDRPWVPITIRSAS